MRGTALGLAIFFLAFGAAAQEPADGEPVAADPEALVNACMWMREVARSASSLPSSADLEKQCRTDMAAGRLLAKSDAIFYCGLQYHDFMQRLENFANSEAHLAGRLEIIGDLNRLAASHMSVIRGLNGHNMGENNFLPHVEAHLCMAMKDLVSGQTARSGICHAAPLPALADPWATVLAVKGAADPADPAWPDSTKAWLEDEAADRLETFLHERMIAGGAAAVLAGLQGAGFNCGGDTCVLKVTHIGFTERATAFSCEQYWWVTYGSDVEVEFSCSNFGVFHP